MRNFWQKWKPPREPAGSPEPRLRPKRRAWTRTGPGARTRKTCVWRTFCTSCPRTCFAWLRCGPNSPAWATAGPKAALWTPLNSARARRLAPAALPRVKRMLRWDLRPRADALPCLSKTSPCWNSAPAGLRSTFRKKGGPKRLSVPFGENSTSRARSFRPGLPASTFGFRASS